MLHLIRKTKKKLLWMEMQKLLFIADESDFLKIKKSKANNLLDLIENQ